MTEVKTIQFTGTFDFPFDVPFMLHQMPDKKTIGFELLGPEFEFINLLAKTPECNDFRQLGTKHWMAYATVLDDENVAVRAQGGSIYDALMELRKKLKYED